MDMIGRIRVAAREGQPVEARERTYDSAVAQHGFEVLRVRVDPLWHVVQVSDQLTDCRVSAWP